MSLESWSSFCRSYTRSRKKSYVLILLYVTQGDLFLFFQAEDGIRDLTVTGVQTCALPISDEMGASAQLTQRTRAQERRPRGPRLRIEQIERVGHRPCTSCFSRSARPVGMTRVWPLARTTTMSSRPITARCSLSDQTTERRTSSARVTFPTTTLPCGSGLRMRSNASHEPMSSQRNEPATTARRLGRSNTATSTATRPTAPKKTAMSPAASAGQDR